MNLHDYGPVMVPLITPFSSDGAVEYDAAVTLARALVAEGNADSIVVAGTTGEFHALTNDERRRLLKEVYDGLDGACALGAGVGCASTGETVALAQYAQEIGYELCMVLAPYYAKPNQRELVEHFQAVSDAVSMNILLYNIPIFTGVNIEPATVAELSKLPNVVGIKEEAELRPKQITEYVNATDPEFLIFCGDDTMILEAYAQGGTARIAGVVSGGAHLIGRQIREMIALYLAGDIERSAVMQQNHFKLFRSWGQNNRTNPVALLKSALNLTGKNAGYPRRPLLPGTEEEVSVVRETMQSIGLLS